MKWMHALLLAALWPVNLALAEPPAAQDWDYLSGRPAAPSEVWQVVRGGKLYDDWIETRLAPTPERKHPALAGTKLGAASGWRCKTCHGWDYAGTKFGPGLTTRRTASEAQLTALLRAAPHGYDAAKLGAEDITALWAFLARGVVKSDRYIDAKGRSRGDARRGQPYFETVCAACHGYDGRALGFWDGKTVVHVGDEARDEPAEVLHKIRFGHPGHHMVALFPLGANTAADILAYAQTLPHGDE